MFEYYYESWYEPLDVYAWSDATASTFYGTYTFEYGEFTCHNERVWDCWADDCHTLEPGTDDAANSWFLTGY